MDVILVSVTSCIVTMVFITLLLLVWCKWHKWRTRAVQCSSKYEEIDHTKKPKAPDSLGLFQHECFTYVGAPTNVQPPNTLPTFLHFSNRDIPFTLPPSVSSTSISGGVPPGDTSAGPAPGYGGDAPATAAATAASSELQGTTPTTLPVGYSLGSINPDLYRGGDGTGDGDAADDALDFPEDHIGRIWFTLSYDHASEKLQVTIVKARNLPSRVLGNMNSCDPFVRCPLTDTNTRDVYSLMPESFHFRITLLPDERRPLQTKQKRKTCNPKFNETFVFQVPIRCLADYVLKVTVVDVDRCKKHVMIGHSYYPLREWDNFMTGRSSTDDASRECGPDTNKTTIWRDLEKDSDESLSERGELRISLCYNETLERLTVVVFEGRKLPVDTDEDHHNEPTAGEFAVSEDSVTDLIPSSTQSGSLYIRVSLTTQTKQIKTKKTSVISYSTTPTFNESFQFKVTPPQIATVGITVVVYTTQSLLHLSPTFTPQQKGKKEITLGRCIFGSMMFARGKELEHWNEMLSREKQGVVQWHALSP